MNWSPHQPMPMPDVDVQVELPLWDAEPAAAETVRRAIRSAATLVPTQGEVSVLLTHDAAVRELNRTWRRIDKPTNVLSFPTARPAGIPADAPGGGPLGDIAIAYETLKREAADEGKPFLHHLAHLAVHGFLHLLGYDHQTDSQAEVMENLERAALAGLGVADPYHAHETGNA